MLVRANGQRLWVERDGVGGPPVMVPTGAGVELYRRTLSPGFRSTHQVFYVEMRGTGGSAGTIAGAEYPDLADDLEGVRAELGIGPAVVLGHSNHGAIAVEHALRHPAGSAGVVSVASVPRGRGARVAGLARWDAEASPEQQRRMSDAAAEFAAMDIASMSVDEQLIRHSISIGGLVFRDPDTMPGYWSSVPRGIGDYLTWMADALERWDCTHRLPGLTRPLLAVVGGYDYACPMQTWDGVLDGVGAATLEVFTESSHHPQVEEQTRFDQTVGAFISRCFA